MSKARPERYVKFRSLHAQGEAFLMPNAWDGASAVLLKHLQLLAGVFKFLMGAKGHNITSMMPLRTK